MNKLIIFCFKAIKIQCISKNISAWKILAENSFAYIHIHVQTCTCVHIYKYREKIFTYSVSYIFGCRERMNPLVKESEMMIYLPFGK